MSISVGMQTGHNPTVDASAVHPPEIRKDDPRHLDNIMGKIHSLNAQSSSDTKYDPVPPPRVNREGKQVREAFEAALETPDIKLIGELLYALGALAAIVVVMAVFSFLDPAIYSSISEVKYGTTFIGLATVMSTLNILYIYFALKTNEIIQWYPPLKDQWWYY